MVPEPPDLDALPEEDLQMIYVRSIDGYMFALEDILIENIVGYRTEEHWRLILDRRLGIDVEPDDLFPYLWFSANAMAVASGWASHTPQARQFSEVVPLPKPLMEEEYVRKDGGPVSSGVDYRITE